MARNDQKGNWIECGKTKSKGEYARKVDAYDEGALAFEDLTARARIHAAALKHFGEKGYERATIRRDNVAAR